MPGYLPHLPQVDAQKAYTPRAKRVRKDRHDDAIIKYATHGWLLMSTPISNTANAVPPAMISEIKKVYIAHRAICSCIAFTSLILLHPYGVTIVEKWGGSMRFSRGGKKIEIISTYRFAFLTKGRGT